jgi:hypothetical protein
VYKKQGGDTDLGAVIDGGIGFVLQPAYVRYSFMQFGTKGDAKEFFLPSG